jgi:hypothetical protein
VQHLLARPWVQALLAERQLAFEKLSKQLYVLPQSTDRQCLFLGDQKQCLIEQHEGRDYKPDECKRFPFAVVADATGRKHYDSSAFCKMVTERHLIAPVDLLPPNPDEIDPGPILLKARIPMGVGRRTIDLATLDHWHAAMAQWIQQTAPTPQGFLQAVQASLATQTGLVLPTAQKVVAAQAPWPIRRDRWVTWLYLRRPYGWYGLWRLQAEGLYRDPKILPEPVALVAIQRMPWPTDRTTDAWLVGYCLNVMRRKVLLTYGYNLQRLVRLATVGVALIRWYAKAFATLQGLDAPGPDDIILAIRLVERYYTGHQPAFFDTFDRGPLRQRLNHYFCHPA